MHKRVDLLYYSFLKKLYIQFFFFLMGATALFASGDLFARMTALSSGFLFFMFALFMVPLMVGFALPIASSCAIATVVSNLFLHDEILLLRFLPAARNALARAVGTFSCSIFLFAFPLLFSWIPQSYGTAKKFLSTAAHHHLDSLQSQKWHTVASGFTVRFMSKEKDTKGDFTLKNIIIRYQEKHKTAASLIFAKEGMLRQGILCLHNGKVYSGPAERLYLAQFEQMNLDMAQISGINDLYKSEKNNKFLSTPQLLKQSKIDILSWLELHKRWSQLLWNILIPLFSFLFMICFSNAKSNILRIISMVGVLFLLFYFSTNVAMVCSGMPVIAFLLFYGLPFLLGVGLVMRYKREW